MSHNPTMENTVKQNQTPTNENTLLSHAEAEEYRLYKQRKRLSDAAAALAKTQTLVKMEDDVQLICQRARRLKQAAVCVPPSKLTQAQYYLSGSEVSVNCLVGGNGETFTKVKAYEARQVAKRKVNEITLTIAPSLLDACRYGEIRREIRRIKRAVGKTNLKVRVEKTYSPTALSRIARIACEAGAKFFSVPYFEGCERLKNDLTGECRLEITNVHALDKFKKMLAMGVGRIGVDRAFEMYTQLLKEGEEKQKEDTRYASNKEQTQKQA